METSCSSEEVSSGYHEMLFICCYATHLIFLTGQSGYIKRNDFALIKQIFPRAKIETIDNAAHWVHADKPTEFLDLVSDFILKKSK